MCIRDRVNNGYFGKDFPEECPDGQGCVGTEVKDLKAALQACLLYTSIHQCKMESIKPCAARRVNMNTRFMTRTVVMARSE